MAKNSAAYFVHGDLPSLDRFLHDPARAVTTSEGGLILSSI
jgi:hypothetical protein